MLFVSGSRSISVLPQDAKVELGYAMAVHETIIVGDCHGVDTLVQQYCKDLGYHHVRVYHIGEHPRNNLAFNTVKVPGNRYAMKDTQMARDADRGLVIWDGVSTGSGMNINRLRAANKPVTVITVRPPNGGVEW